MQKSTMSYKATVSQSTVTHVSHSYNTSKRAHTGPFIRTPCFSLTVESD